MLSPSLCFVFASFLLRCAMARREGSHRRIFLHFAIRLATTETLHGYPAGPVKHEAKFQRDFIGDFGYLRFRGFFLKLHLFCFFTCDVAGRSRTTCQAPRAVKSPRPHVVTSAREPSEHLSNLFDVIRCLVHLSMFIRYAAFYDRSRTQSHTVLTSDTSG